MTHNKTSGGSAGKGRGRGRGYGKSSPEPVFTEEVGSCIFLEEVKYFFMDTFRCSAQTEIKYILALGNAVLKMGQEAAFTYEVTEGLIANVEDEIHAQEKKYSDAAVIVRDRSMKLRIVVMEFLDEEIKRALCSLHFPQGGRIEVFDIPIKRGGAICNQDHRFIMQLYAAHVRALDGALWDVPMSLREESLFARSVVCCPIYYDRTKGQLFMLTLWDPYNRHQNWGPAGGDVDRRKDKSLSDAARREFDEELEPFGISMSDISVCPLNRTDAFLMLPVDLDLKPTARYEITPHVFFEVKQTFFEDTFDTVEPSTWTKVVDLEAVREQGFVTEKSHPAELRRFHLDARVKFLEHIEWGWAACDIRCDPKDSAEDGEPSNCMPGPFKFVDKTKRNSRLLSPRDTAILTNMKTSAPHEWVTFARRFLTQSPQQSSA